MDIFKSITDNVPRVKTTDTLSAILDMMDDAKLTHLPIVDDGKLVGWLSETHILDIDDDNRTAQQIALHEDVPAVVSDQPLTTVISTMHIFTTDVVPIIDKKNNYLGCCTAQTVVESLADSLGANASGKVVAMRFNTIDYSLTRVVDIVESNDAKIYSITTNLINSNDTVEVFVKLNIQEVSAIISSLARYGIEAWELGATSESNSVLMRNYNSLMQYLKIDN